MPFLFDCCPDNYLDIQWQYLNLIVLTFLGYLCGIRDSVSIKPREPYVIGDSSETVYLTEEELKKRLREN
ncbi:hypothetical protein [Thermococcus sp.]|uniref:hypothetical protein n=1 Tax=Thermococcus sp. TaxID=35749 RepID=UPI0025E67C24|nr:hypothetical protein [Thermococcus sp.]